MTKTYEELEQLRKQHNRQSAADGGQSAAGIRTKTYEELEQLRKQRREQGLTGIKTKTYEELEQLRKQRREQGITGTRTKTYKELETLRHQKNAPRYAQRLQKETEAYLLDVDGFTKSYNQSIGDTKTFVSAADASAWQTEQKNSISELIQRRDTLRRSAEQYRTYFGDAYTDSLLEYIDRGNAVFDSVEKGSQAYVDFRNSFLPTQEQQSTGETEESLFQFWVMDQTYRPKYAGMRSEELAERLTTLPEGEEYDYVKKLIGSVAYQELGEIDIDEARHTLALWEKWGNMDDPEGLKDYNDYMALESQKQMYLQHGYAYGIDDADSPRNPINRPGGIEDQQRAILKKYGIIDPNQLGNERAALRQKIVDATRAKSLKDMERVADPASASYDADFFLYSPNDPTLAQQYLRNSASEDPHVQQVRGLISEYDELEQEKYVFNNTSSERLAYIQERQQAILNELGIADYSLLSQWQYVYMTREEIETYNYYHDLYGAEESKEYLDLLSERINSRKAFQISQEYGDSFLGEMYIQFQSGLDRIGQDWVGLFDMLAGNDTYTPASAWDIAAQNSMERLGKYGENIQIFGNSLGQVTGQLVNSGTYALPSLLTSAALTMVSKSAGTAMAANTLKNIASFSASAITGLQSAGGGYRDLISSGNSVEAARIYGTLVGLSEGGLSYLLGGIGQTGGALTEAVLGQTISKLDNVFVACAAQLGKNFASEGVEEWIQYGLEGWFKNIAQGTNYRVDMLSDEALYNGLLGSISASVMEGPMIVFGEVGTHMNGEKLQVQGFTGAQLQKLGSVMPEDIRKLTANLTEKSSPHAIGKAFQKIGAFLSEQDQQQVVLRMVDQGVMLENAQTLVGIVEHLAAGGSLTQQQTNLLNANESLGQALMQTIHDAADPQAASTQAGNTQAEADPGQATSTQNAITQQNPAAESAQPQQATSTNQDLLLQAEGIFGRANLSVAQISALNAYRQSVAKIDVNQQKIYQLEQQLQAQLPAANKSELRHIQANIDRLKAKNERIRSALRKAEDTVSLRDLINRTRNQLQKGTNQNESIEADAKKQTNVLDSYQNSGIMKTSGPKSYEEAYANREIITDGSHMENGKLKPNIVFRAGEHGYLYETDSRGRIINVCTDHLKKKSHEGRLQHNPNTLGKEYGDHAGHLIGDRFGGSNDLDNLVSMAKDVNLSEFAKLENLWAKEIKKHPGQVGVDIQIHYGEGSRPIAFTVQFRIADQSFQQTIANVNHGP